MTVSEASLSFPGLPLPVVRMAGQGMVGGLGKSTHCAEARW